VSRALHGGREDVIHSARELADFAIGLPGGVEVFEGVQLHRPGAEQKSQDDQHRLPCRAISEETVGTPTRKPVRHGE